MPFSQSPGTGQTYFLPTLAVLSAMGLLVLRIACANIAGLVLVRACRAGGKSPCGWRWARHHGGLSAS